MRPSALVFAYSSDGGLMNSVFEVLRSVFAPSSNPCTLCRLTHTPLGMKKAWWDYIKNLGVPCVFVHRNELKRKYGVSTVDLPAVLKPAGDRLLLMIEADEINRCKDLNALMRLVDRYMQV